MSIRPYLFLLLVVSAAAAEPPPADAPPAAPAASAPPAAPDAAPAPPPAEPAAPAPGKPPEPLNAYNLKGIAEKNGTYITVKGTVDRYEKTSAGHYRIYFRDGIYAWVKKETEASHQPWLFEDYVSKDMIAGGKIEVAQDEYYMLITGPHCFAESLDKLDWSKIAPADAPKPEVTADPKADPKMDPKTAPALAPVKLQEATVRQIAVGKTELGLELAVTTLNGVWKKKASDKSGAFIYQTPTSNVPGPMGVGTQMAQAKHTPWPDAYSFLVTRVADTSATQPPPTSLASYMLVESTMSGLVIPEKLHFLGDINPGEDFADGSEALFLIGGLAPGSTVIAPSEGEPLLLDMAREGKLEVLCNMQILGAAKVSEVLDTISKLADPETQALMEKCAQLQAAILTTKGAAIKQNAAKLFLQSLVAKIPNHMTGKVLLAAANGKLPAKLSDRTAIFKLEEFYGRLHPALLSMPTDRAEKRKLHRDFEDEFKKIHNVCPDDMKPSPTLIEKLLDAARDWMKHDDISSERAKEDNEAFLDTLEAARTEFGPHLKSMKK